MLDKIFLRNKNSLFKLLPLILISLLSVLFFKLFHNNRNYIADIEDKLIEIQRSNNENNKRINIILSKLNEKIEKKNNIISSSIPVAKPVEKNDTPPNIFGGHDEIADAVNFLKG